MKEKTTIHVWLLLVLSLAGLGGAGWYAHASSPAITGLMPVLGDAYGPFTQKLTRLAGSAVPVDSVAESDSDATALTAGSTKHSAEAADDASVVASVSDDASEEVSATAVTDDADASGDVSTDAAEPAADVAGNETPDNDNAEPGSDVSSDISSDASDSASTEPVITDTDESEGTVTDEVSSNNPASDSDGGTVNESANASASTTETNAERDSGRDSESVLAALRETELSLLTEYADNIEFTPERWTLNESARDALSSVFETLFIYSDVNLQMDVHVFDTDDAELNQVISEQRASAMRGYLLDRGLEQGRVQIIGRGDTQTGNSQIGNIQSGDTTSSASDAVISRVTLMQLDGENK